MAKSEDYWRERFQDLEDAQSKKGAEYFAELEKQYNKATLAVNDDIEKWYSRFAKNNQITLQEARKLLNSRELEEFKWNVMEYIEKGRTLNVSKQWAKQLENASAKFHISRLEALKLQMQNHVEVLYGTEEDEVAELMKRIYTDGYYHTAYEIQKGFNIGYDLMRLDTNKIEKVLSKPWAADGSNFSNRIWKQKSQLVSELHNNLTQAIIRGQNPHVVTEAIAKRFNVSKGQAGRLVMTESAFFASASNRDCYKDLGVEQYEILATLDKKTSDICRALDGKVFPMSEYAVGVTAPPFHVWCRTTTVPYFDDEFELDTKRAARDDNGKTYYVPSNMKYEEWYKKHVKDVDTPIQYARIVNGKTQIYTKQNVSGVNCNVYEEKHKFSNGTRDLSSVQAIDAIFYETPDGTKFVIPKNLDVTKQTLTAEKAIELYQNVPKNIRKKAQEFIEIVDYENPRDAYWRSVYKTFSKTYATGGDERLTFYAQTYHDEDYVVFTYSHEIGHKIDRSLAATKGKYYSDEQEWSDAMNADEKISGKKSMRSYGENSPHEDFADSVAYYVKDKKMFKKSYPNRTKLIKKFLK